ncbi:MAG: flagellar basal body P-ring biosynthesis protein FlgA, partial [Verrucomicrobiales bacterium]|nr:flagellar basal body P-ring biosynthesis protein FlgA [Verrucomicrobiales bacterium]
MNAAFRSIFIMFCLLQAAHGQSAEPAPSIRLRAEVQVSSRGIFLSDIVENPGELASIRIADAPVFGRSTMLLRAQVAEMVHQQLPEVAVTNWAGAARTRISRKTQMLDESMLKELLGSTLQRDVVRDRGELELRLMRPWAAISIPDEALSVRVLDLPNAGVTPNFILRFEIQAGAQSVGIWQVPLQARIIHEIWVARSSLARGQILQSSDWLAEKRDILILRDAVGAIHMNDDSCELTENIPAGSPLLSRSIKPRTIVRRGKMIEALLQDGKLVISVKAEALEDGAVGQTIRVRNMASRREFRGKV